MTQNEDVRSKKVAWQNVGNNRAGKSRCLGRTSMSLEVGCGMSVGLHFYSIIVPFEKVGGYGYLAEFLPDRIGTGVWYDQDLLCMNGGMAGNDASFLAAPLEEMGLAGLVEDNGEHAWQDFCICTSGNGPWRGPCDWLEYNGSKNTVSLVGKDGPAILPNLSFLRDTEVQGARISVKFFNNLKIEAGYVFIDDLEFGYNFTSDGKFDLFIPSAVVQGLNEDSDRHVLHVRHLVSERNFSLNFKLVDGDNIELSGNDRGDLIV